MLILVRAVCGEVWAEGDGSKWFEEQGGWEWKEESCSTGHRCGCKVPNVVWMLAVRKVLAVVGLAVVQVEVVEDV